MASVKVLCELWYSDLRKLLSGIGKMTLHILTDNRLLMGTSNIVPFNTWNRTCHPWIIITLMDGWGKFHCSVRLALILFKTICSGLILCCHWSESDATQYARSIPIVTCIICMSQTPVLSRTQEPVEIGLEQKSTVLFIKMKYSLKISFSLYIWSLNYCVFYVRHCPF